MSMFSSLECFLLPLRALSDLVFFMNLSVVSLVFMVTMERDLVMARDIFLPTGVSGAFSGALVADATGEELCCPSQCSLKSWNNYCLWQALLFAKQ